MVNNPTTYDVEILTAMRSRCISASIRLQQDIVWLKTYSNTYASDDLAVGFRMCISIIELGHIHWHDVARVDTANIHNFNPFK